MRPIPLKSMLRARWPAALVGLAVLLAVVGVIWSAVVAPDDSEDAVAVTGLFGSAGALLEEELRLAKAAEADEWSRLMYAEATEAGIDPVTDEALPDSLVAGEVRRPSGEPAPGATVTLFQLLTAWPEWQRTALDVAITGDDGKFQFQVARRPDLLIGFQHPDFAGGLQAAPANTPFHVLSLRHGLDLTGVVSSDAGMLPRAVVSLESTVMDDRRARSTTTDANGRFYFRMVAVGTVRVVARHEMYQPVVEPSVEVGVEKELDLHFDKASLSLSGQVFAGASQQAVAGAEVLALRQGERLGLSEPVRARTDSDGRFRLTGLARGNVQIEVRHGDYSVSSRALVVGPSPLPVIFEMQPRARLAGVLAKSAESPFPLPLADLLLTFRSSANEVVQATVQQDGSFAFKESVSLGNGRLEIPDGTFAFRRSTSSALSLYVDESGEFEDLRLEVGAPAIVLGRVTDEQGEPLPGARISVTRRDLVAERFLRAGSALLSADFGQLNSQMQRESGDGIDVLLAVTNPNGEFRIAGQQPGALGVLITHPGHGGRRIEVTIPEGDEIPQLPPIRLPRGCIVTGTVMRGGRPVAGVRIDTVVGGSPLSVVSDIDGRYTLRDLPPGSRRVRARYATSRIEKEISVLPEEPGVLDLVFETGRVLAGTVRGLEGQAVEGAMVGVHPRGGRVATDSSGNFQLEVPKGEVELRVAYGGQDFPDRHVVEPSQEEVTIMIDAPARCTVTARVLGLPGRKVLPGVLLRISDSIGEPGFRASDSRWIETPGGQMRHPWFPVGSWRVMVVSEGYAPVFFSLGDLEAGVNKDLGTILLQPGCILRGVVVDENDDPVAGAQVLLGEEMDCQLYDPELATDNEGSFVISGIASAARTLLVKAPGYAWQVINLNLPVDVLNPSPMRIQLTRGSTIIARPSALSAAVRYVELHRSGRLVARAEVDADGRAVFENWGPGTYDLTCSKTGSESEWTSVTLEDSGEEFVVDLP